MFLLRVLSLILAGFAIIITVGYSLYAMSRSIPLAILITLALIIGSYFLLRLWSVRGNRVLELTLGPTPETLEQDGIQFRDLNKNGKLDPYEDPRVSVDDRVEDLLSKMTLEEKVGQMFSPMAGGGDKDGNIKYTKGPLDKFTVLEIIIKHKINTFATLGRIETEAFAKWHNNIQKLAEKTRLGIPITLCSDPRHEFLDSNNPMASLIDASLSKWPQPLGLAASRDPDLVKQFGDIARQELSSIGIRFALHPAIDLATEPRWGRISGTFGEDAELTSTMTTAYIAGFQGEQIDNQSVACCVKHFPGGGPQKDGLDPHSFKGREQVYEGANFEYHTIPFKVSFDAGAAATMPYYAIPVGLDVEEVGFNFNHHVLTTMLREEMKFEGVVHTDYNIIKPMKLFGTPLLKIPAMAWGVEALSPKQRVEKAVNAGVDQIGGEGCVELLIELVTEGSISEERIDQSVRRVLKLKFQLGLFDDPFVDIEHAIKTCKRHDFVEAGEEAMRRSLVLLKNGDSIPVLPLKDTKKLYTEGFDEGIVDQYAEVVKTPEEADYAILNLKAPTRRIFDDFFSLFFPGGDLDFKPKVLNKIQKVMQTCPTIINIYLERPAVIPEIKNEAAAIIGNFGCKQHIILDLIFGKFKPRGKLPFELPSSMEAVKKQKSDLPYDSENPSFDFGHGLEYA